RLAAGEPLVVVTTAEGYDLVGPARDRIPGLRRVLVTGTGSAPPGTHSLEQALGRADGTIRMAATGPADPALLLFTAGTLGRPKAAVHVHDDGGAQDADR